MFTKAIDKITGFFAWIIGFIDKIIRKVYVTTGRILFAIGCHMLKGDTKYALVRSTIENLFGSIEIYLRVVRVEEHRLYVRFVAEISSSNGDKVNWFYFLKELVYQLGCYYTDVIIDYQSTNKESRIYFIDITKTALSNLEKGTTPAIPSMFEEENTEGLMNKAIDLSRHEEISPKILEEKLHIQSGRADDLYKQLKKTDILSRRSRVRRVN